MRVTVHSVCSTTGPVRPYGELPRNGSYHVADITVEAISGNPRSAFYSDFNVVTPDGRRYQGKSGPEPRLAAIYTQIGQKYRGNVAFDAPQGHNIVSWEPLFAQVSARFQY
jgi:hypothetical protein